MIVRTEAFSFHLNVADGEIPLSQIRLHSNSETLEDLLLERGSNTSRHMQKKT